jgi:hypothetical protein
VEKMEEEEKEEAESSTHNPSSIDKSRPNYFLAIRITDPEIRQACEQVSDW